MILRHLAVLLILLVSGCAHATESFLIAPQGETVISSVVGKISFQIRLETQIKEIGHPGDARPNATKSICTYSRYPCSVVTDFKISADGGPLFIPKSAFCDLADLTRAEIEESKDAATLTLYGGDASESYVVKIEVDQTRVRRRTLASALSPGDILEETIYHLRTLGD